tara:strand:+ start:45 stop:1304 length:1260 start_codon:yes stop_codon:yes gene_type:complete
MGKNSKVDLNKLMHSLFSSKNKPAEVYSSFKNSLFNKTGLLEKKEFIKRFFNLSKLSRKSDSFITGLDIGTSAVKSALFSFDGASSLQLVDLDMEEISHEDFQSPGRLELIRDKVMKMQARNSLRGKVVVSIPLPELLVELMYLPVMPQEDLDKAVRWEAREKLLVDEESYITDYIALGEVMTSQQAQQEILFFSIPRKHVLDNYQVLSGLGLQITAIRPSFLAIIQGFEDKSLWREDEVVGLLDIGAGSSTFSIISGGCLHFNRCFNISGDSITRSIADYCRVSYEEAERQKRDIGMSKMALEEDRKEGGVSDQPLVRISHSMGLYLDQLITEIQHTSDYFLLQVSSAPFSKMSRLILSGGGAAIKGIADFFKSRLNIPVDTPDPFNYIQLQSADLAQKQFSGSSVRFAAAIGLGQKL